MLTEEQIKNLKPGDPIVINGTVNKINEDGHILATCGGSSVWLDNPDKLSLPSEHGTSLSRRSSVGAETEVPTPKYDPCRLFKEGDIVKRRTVDGRTDSDVAEGVALTVTTSESKYGNVTVQDPHGRRIVTKCVFLSLITPVEELEPFTVVHKQALQHFQINHGELNYMTFPYGLHKSNGWYHTITTAKAAAEAECDRLNAEYRKELENDHT